MTLFDKSLATVALLCLAAAAGAPASAASSTSSAVSDSASSTASSASDSLKSSGDGSSKAARTVAEGEYRIVEVAEAAGRPGLLRLALQPLADVEANAGLHLFLPQATAARHGLAAGQTIAARQRPYGVAFARGDATQAFFLVLADDWARELPPHALAL